jgi:hypothetical protein
MGSVGGLYGMKNSMHYVYVKKFNELAIFDKNGIQLTDRRGSILDCVSIIPIQILSIASVTGNGSYVEVVFEDEKCTYEGTVTGLYRKLRKSGYLRTPFRISHNDISWNPMHIVLIYKEGTITREKIEEYIGKGVNWKQL